ncbi:MAG: TolC family protein [Chitinivibrionales bacterium]
MKRWQRLGIILLLHAGASAGPMSLPKAQALLFARNNQIKAAELRHEQSMNKLIETRADWYPTVEVVGNYIFTSKRRRISFSRTLSLFDDTIPLPMPDTFALQIDEPVGDYDRYEMGIDAIYPVFTGFARSHATRAAEAEIEAYSLMVDIERNTQSLNLGVLYFTWEDATAGVRTQQKKVQRIAEHAGYMRDLYNAGLQAYSQVLIATARLEKARLDVLKAQGVADSLSLEITHLLGIQDTLAYPAGYHFDSFYSRTKPKRTATDVRRPELQALTFRINQITEAQNVLRSDRFPSLALRAGYRVANPGLQMGTEEVMRYGTVGLHLNWTIYDGMRDWAKREQLKRQQSIIENRRAYTREEFNKHFRLARQQYEQAQAMEEATQKSLEAAQAVAKDMENALDAGTAVSVDYLESLNEVSEAERARDQATTFRKVSFLRLLYALGETIDF